MKDLPDVLFYGCIGQPGHFVYAKGLSIHAYSLLVEVTGFKELDGGLTPKDPSQTQGAAKLHSQHGWTALAWWDRSGADQRYGSNSVLLARGEFEFPQMLARLEREYPDVFARQPVPVFLA